MADQTDEQPTKRMTTAEAAKAAQDAMALAASAVEDIERLSEKLTELDQRTRDGSTPDLDAEMNRVDGRIYEALAPLHDEVHKLQQKGTLTPESSTSLHGVLARLEDAERKVAAVDIPAITQQVAHELHAPMADLRRRLAGVEGDLKNQAGNTEDPAVSGALDSRIGELVRNQLQPATADMARLVNGAFSRLEALEAATGGLAEGVASATAENVQALHSRLDDLADYVRRLDGQIPATVNSAIIQTPARNLGAARKVLALMRAVTHIGKERQADMGTGGKFRFRGIDEAMDAVGHAMRDVGLILSTEVLKDETTTVPVTKKGDGRNGPYESTILWTTTKTTMRYTFVDPDDGSTHTIEMIGEGRDASDKSTSKAGSMAFKYALLQALCIPVTGLDDSDASPPQVMENERTRTAQQASEPSSTTGQHADEQAKARRAGEALSAIRNVYRVEGGPRAQHARLVEIMQRIKAENLLTYVVEDSTLDQHGKAAMATLQAPPPSDAIDDARASTEPPPNDEDY